MNLYCVYDSRCDSDVMLLSYMMNVTLVDDCQVMELRFDKKYQIDQLPHVTQTIQQSFGIYV